MGDLIEKIIVEVQKHDCLYNLQSQMYKNFYYKEDLWQKIGDAVGVPGEEAKKKWKSVRDSYKRHKNKENQPSGSGAVFRKPYKYTECLRFLDDIPAERRTISNVMETSMDSIIYQSSDSENGTTPTPQKKKKKSNEMQEQMEVFLNAATASIENIASTVKTNSTSQLFESLSSKILEANLTKQQIYDIECAVASLVYSKLGEYMTN